jgi:hypothetical protein
MRAILLGLVLAVAAGCSKDITKDVENLATRACACTEAECARKVLTDFVTLLDNNRDATGDQHESQASAKKMAGCLIESGVPAKELLAAMRKFQ